MRKLTLLVSLFIATLAVPGCSNSSADDGSLKKPASINNDAPGAQSAPAAPAATSTPAPGDVLKTKRSTGGGAAPPPPANSN